MKQFYCEFCLRMRGGTRYFQTEKALRLHIRQAHGKPKLDMYNNMRVEIK